MRRRDGTTDCSDGAADQSTSGGSSSTAGNGADRCPRTRADEPTRKSALGGVVRIRASGQRCDDAQDGDRKCNTMPHRNLISRSPIRTI
jgi:hypothetical protein